MSHFFINDGFGVSAVLIPVFLLASGVRLMRVYRVNLLKWFFNFGFVMIWCSAFLACMDVHTSLFEWIGPDYIRYGGRHGEYICRVLVQNIGMPGLIITLVVTGLLYAIYLNSCVVAGIRKIFHPRTPMSELSKDLPKAKEDVDVMPIYTAKDEEEEMEPEKTEEPQPVVVNLMGEAHEENEATVAETSPSPIEPEDKDMQMQVETGREVEEASSDILAPYNPRLDLENYKFPPVSLLAQHGSATPPVNMKEQRDNQNRITDVLHNFGVEISGIKATIGPTVTLYEITPAEGVRIAKIRNLEDDIALSLAAMGIRIIAPIPGKGTIGIEVPNKVKNTVSMKSILNSRKFQESSFDLPIALGKTITNEVFMLDLAKAPHILVAGATGQGKSVGLNAIITSLLYKKHPAELKFVMIDPKKVEFSVYNPIERQFLAKVEGEDEEPVITDITKVIRTLKSLCQEMDNRYDLLKQARARNIKEYNEKFISRKLNPQNGHHYLPYIVVVIDEFGDLIMTAGKEIELPIARIAQLARAVGIHMIIATQRPTTNIITGTIKANFPMRIAFKVMSSTDSRTILDRTGANRLIGRGDMLVTNGNDPTRVQCAFVDTDEIENICSYISQQQGYVTAFELPEVSMDEDGGDKGSSAGGYGGGQRDPLFEEAARLVVIHQLGSASLIQRKFSVGYNRAGRLMDQLEAAGVVGPSRGSKARDVLCANENDLDRKLNNQ